MKVWFIIAAILVLVGCIIFVAVMTALDWDFSRLSTIRYETNEYSLDSDFKNISIVTNTADIALVPCQTAISSVVCREQEKVKHSVLVQDDTLVIRVEDTRKWYDHIGISFFGSTKITVYVPQGEYGQLSVSSTTGDTQIPAQLSFEGIDISATTGDVTSRASVSGLLKIKVSTGSVCVEDVRVANLEVSATTGDVNVQSIACREDLKISVNTGDISLKDVTAAGSFSIKASTGDIHLDSCDAAGLFIHTDTGNVSGTLLSDKVFIAHTDTGRVDVPKTTAGGKCEITTDTGNIQIRIE